MRFILYIVLFPLFIYSQTTNNNDKKINYSYNFGAKMYTGNIFLDEHKFSREGLYFNFNIFSEKVVAKKTFLIKKISLNLNNAFFKKINISEDFGDVEISPYSTRIPNILSCDINFTIGFQKKINSFFSHSFYLKFRAWPLFYKKGSIFGGESNSLGGLISSEENGSFPGLNKTTKILYSINYLYNQSKEIKLLFFLNSDFGINTINSSRLYPGFGIQFDQALNFNRK